MARSLHHPRQRSETLYSPVLFQKKITVTETEGSHGRRRLSGTRLKLLIFPFLHWMLRHTSVAVALLPVRVLVWTSILLYHWPANPLRRCCEAVCRVAGNSAHQHKPQTLYRKFLSNALAVMENYFYLHRHGIDRVTGCITLTTQDRELLRELVNSHGGAILAVPHNIASAFSSLKLNQAVSLLVVARNSPTIARTKIALEFFERMQVPILMVRGGNLFELSRSLFAALRGGKLVAATLDNLDDTDRGVKVQMFGQTVGLAGWAARIAARMEVPLLPCYFRSEGRQISVHLGEPMITTDITAAAQHYAAFFEHHILADPASWAYLADKSWQKILNRANGLP